MRKHEGIETVLEQVSRIAGLLWEKGWAERNAGNISVNVTGLVPKKPARGCPPIVDVEKPLPLLEGTMILISATGSRMRDIARDPAGFMCIVRVPKAGSRKPSRAGSDACARPSSELPAHLSVHQFLAARGKAEKAVIHTHPGRLIALSHMQGVNNKGTLDSILKRMHPEVGAVYPDGIGFAPYRTPGTVELAAASVKALESRRIALWEKHGVVAVGPGLDEAFDAIDTMEKAAGIYLDCMAAGYEPEGLTDGQIIALRAAFGQ